MTGTGPVFVVGPPRCGTTLTARILGQHPAIFMPGETHFFEDIYARRRELGAPCDDDARARIIERLQTLYDRFRELPDQARVERLFAGAEFRAALNRARSYRDIFSAFLEAQMGAVGKRRWGNQVPRDLFELDRVFAFFTDARVVACVRDPRDFLLSYRDKWQRDGSGWEADRLRRLYHPVITALLWKSSIRTLRAAQRRYGSRIMINPYEALVADPEAQVRAICAFLDEEFRPEMLNVDASNSSAQTTTVGIFTSSVGRWRRDLPVADAVVLQGICRAEMRATGYAPERVRANPLAVATRLASSPFAGCRALAANKAKRGPTLPYLAKRLGALMRA